MDEINELEVAPSAITPGVASLIQRSLDDEIDDESKFHATGLITT